MTKSCNECGESAIYFVKGYDDVDIEMYGGEQDSYWCEKHKRLGAVLMAKPFLYKDFKCEFVGDFDRFNDGQIFLSKQTHKGQIHICQYVIGYILHFKDDFLNGEEKIALYKAVEHFQKFANLV